MEAFEGYVMKFKITNVDKIDMCALNAEFNTWYKVYGVDIENNVVTIETDELVDGGVLKECVPISCGIFDVNDWEANIAKSLGLPIESTREEIFKFLTDMPALMDDRKTTKAKDAHIWNMLCWLEKIDYLIKNGVMDKDKAQSTIARIRGMINKELGVVDE